MLKGIKTQIYPTVRQKIYINDLLGAYRFVYNKCLEHKIEQYANHKKNVGIKELGKFVHGELRKNTDFLKPHNSKVLFQAPIDLLAAYKNFFNNDFGFPKFKSKKDRQSCRFPVDAIAKKAVIGNRLNLTKLLKGLKIACSDRDLEILQNTKIKSATISKEKSGLYFCSFLVDIEIQKLEEPKNELCGIDFGIKTYAVIVNDSGIREITNPKFTRTNAKKLSKLQKSLSKKQKGSNNKEKARVKLAKAYYKISCQKEWFIHNLTTNLVRENRIIGVENLNISGMIQNHKLAGSIQELSLFKIKRQLLYKSLVNDRSLIQIDRFFPSSKLCSNCGYKKEKLKLSERTYKCAACGFKLDRDRNAALNIRNEALRIYKIGKSYPEFTSVEIA